jgi:hypothetical protein
MEIEESSLVEQIQFVRECVQNEKVVPPARFQRATSRLGGERSMQLSYGSKTGKS